jgi:FdhD protein
MSTFIIRKIIKKKADTSAETEDYIAVEKKLRISCSGKDIISLYCTPALIKELIIGFLLTEELIEETFCADSLEITYGDEMRAEITSDIKIAQHNLIRTSGCIGGLTTALKKDFTKITEDFQIHGEDIRTLFRLFNGKSELFRMTGCVHSAALCDIKTILAFAEDIGRHNAVDKVFGSCILRNISFSKKILLVSGRISSEIVSKCIKWGIPVVASRTSATSLALELAVEGGVTLIGFVRANRMNIYTNGQRLN